MTGRILTIAALTGATLLGTVPANAEVGIGADVYNRYVWRGHNIGDAVSVQPYVSYTTGNIEIGAWSAWSITSSANENDLYATYSTGPVAVTVTDYYNPHPNNHFLDYNSDTGAHTVEAMVSYDMGVASIMGAFNFHGDAQDSYYVELGLPLAALSDDESDVSLSVGLGSGAYVTDDPATPKVEEDPTLVVIGLNFSKGDYSASYIVNPDSEQSYLVFGKRL